MKTKEKTRKKRKKFGGWFAVYAFIVFFLVYITASFAFSAGSGITTTVVKSGSVEDSISATGYVFKNSNVILSPISGYIDCLKDDEERAEVGEAVCAVYKNSIDAELKGELREVTEKAENLEKSIKFKSSADGDVAKKEQSISGFLKTLGGLSDKRDVEGVSEIKKEIDALLSKKTEDENSKSELSALEAKKNELIKSLENKAEIVYASQAGCFTPTVDKGEELLSALRLEKEGINHKYLKQLESLDFKNTVSSYVNSGEPLGKIVDNFKWYLAIEVPTAESELIKKGGSVKIRFPEYDSAAVSGSIVSISAEEDGKVIITVKSTRYIKSVYKISKADVQLIKNTYSGVKIPQEALRIVNDKKGVYVRRGNIVKFFPIEIKYTDNEWVIAAENEQGGGLKLYDEVIIKGRDLYDGKVIE